jgi:hypothetical protein
VADNGTAAPKKSGKVQLRQCGGQATRVVPSLKAVKEALVARLLMMDIVLGIDTKIKPSAQKRAGIQARRLRLGDYILSFQ